MDSILPNLLEKKNILLYLKCREEQLKRDLKEIPNLQPPQIREFTKRQLKGRILEVRIFKKLTNEKKFKSTTIKLWKDLEMWKVLKKNGGEDPSNHIKMRM